MTFPQAGMYVIRGCLIVSVQFELHDDVIRQIQTGILDKVHQSRLRGAVLDVSMVEVMDAHIAASLAETVQMVDMLGARTVVVGIQPAVASALMDLAKPPTDMRTAVSVEQALAMLEPYTRMQELATIGDDEPPGDDEIIDEEETLMPEDEADKSLDAPLINQGYAGNE